MGMKNSMDVSYIGGGLVACKVCNSDNQVALVAEISFVAADRRPLDGVPVYLVQKPVICLECGFTELVIPQNDLQALKDA
jgi:hypothetical protein